jgi:hypothetical protein
MSVPPGAERADIEARLARTRQEILALFQPEIDARAARARDGQGSFPRSRTMKLLLSHKGLATVAVAACGLVISRPALALRLLRMLPLAAVAKLLLRRQLAL